MNEYQSLIGGNDRIDEYSRPSQVLGKVDRCIERIRSEPDSCLV